MKFSLLLVDLPKVVNVNKEKATKLPYNQKHSSKISVNAVQNLQNLQHREITNFAIKTTNELL